MAVADLHEGPDGERRRQASEEGGATLRVLGRVDVHVADHRHRHTGRVGFWGGDGAAAANLALDTASGGGCGAAELGHRGAPREPVFHGPERAPHDLDEAVPAYGRVPPAVGANLPDAAAAPHAEHADPGAAARPRRSPRAEDRARGRRLKTGLRRIHEGVQGVHQERSRDQKRQSLRAPLLPRIRSASQPEPRGPASVHLVSLDGHRGGEWVDDGDHHLPPAPAHGVVQREDLGERAQPKGADICVLVRALLQIPDVCNRRHGVRTVLPRRHPGPWGLRGQPRRGRRLRRRPRDRRLQLPEGARNVVLPDL
mmetsp:Transcript_86689/g.250167  ORF Transcript_86689/g.250167 Transcript_86689/m.250167 type:complete len:312 (+) Transcript_86689:2932-3867(+)